MSDKARGKGQEFKVCSSTGSRLRALEPENSVLVV